MRKLRGPSADNPCVTVRPVPQNLLVYVRVDAIRAEFTFARIEFGSKR